jgi:signal transduction histidine kinase
MKYVLLSCLFFLSFIYGFGQTENDPIQKNDSLIYYSRLANNPTSSSSLTKAYVYFSALKDKSITARDTLSTISYLRQIAIIQFQLGDYYGSETSVISALHYLENSDQNDSISEPKVGLYNELGQIHTNLLNYETALKYFHAALKIAKSKDNINIIKNNIALIYLEKGAYALAEKDFLTVYENSLAEDNVTQTSRALNNLAFVQSKLAKPGALEKLQEALEIRIKTNDLAGIYSSYNNMSTYYKDRNNMHLANVYANKAYEAAKSINSASYMEHALAHILSLSKDSKVVEYKRLKDSITTAKQMAENKYALIKFNYQKQEQIAHAFRFQQEQEKQKKVIFQISTLFVVLAAILIMFLLKSRYKKQRLLSVYKTETRISKKVHDEVANDVYHLMTKLQSDTSSNDEFIVDELEDIYNKTRDISKENNVLNVMDNYSELIQELLMGYRSAEVHVITKNLSKIDWSTLPEITKITLYRVLQELMTNMRKHSKANIVVVGFNKIKNKTHIKYTDNGVGCELALKGGLQNTENRMESINGSIIFESALNKGFKAVITV